MNNKYFQLISRTQKHDDSGNSRSRLEERRVPKETKGLAVIGELLRNGQPMIIIMISSESNLGGELTSFGSS